jgi:RimJ/RimL family protein N-acetyltransferase
MRNPFAVGDKVYLRPLEREDAVRIAPWINDPEVTRTLLSHRPMGVAAEEAFLDALASRPGEEVHLGIVARDDDALVGVVGFKSVDPIHRSAELGLFVGDRSRWGRGFGTEATRLLLAHGFDTLNLHRVALRVLAHNTAAIRVYEKCGFQREGVHRAALFREGRYWDDLTLALLADEWRAARGR